ncbi:MAG: leucine--tRNA ligase [Oscillospiraceae bacterium]|nr:leucine--tRNA ligase [Oscillospiraceae bacterium]
MKYDFTAIENKWQKIWEEKELYKAVNGADQKKFYALIEFPYPSGVGLHVGHARPYTAMDVIARKHRMQGENVLFPMGYDAFGLPTENYAIKNHIHPAIVTKRNIETFRRQLKALGYSFDWDREINTTDPSYFKWTQWIFLQLYKNGLAYKTKMPVNWCTSCKCVLANEEVVDNVCERCGSPVIRKEQSQWMLRITKYAQRLLDDLDDLDFIDRVKLQQRNWIGRSTGAEVKFSSTLGDEILIYTTRPDTLFGATYMVLSPEHALLEKWMDRLDNADEVKTYQAEAAAKSDFERTELAKDKTGVMLQGVKGINPVNGNEIPIFISDYVLSTYGTGAIMAVPGHDDRDWAFAKKFGCEIIEVVKGGNVEEAAFTDCATGEMVNSGFLDGMSVEDAKKAIIAWLTEKGIGEAKVNFKLRDWVFSRQRYWGEPIPIIHCPKCGTVPMDEKDLPLLLPEVESYEPTDDGHSPLANMTDWVNTTCPCCGGPAKRETDTMPQWAGSSWYFLRYMDPHNDEALASKEALAYWSPVDWYNGGMEHTTLHLLYSRFWHKFLYDIGVVPTKEPYAKRTSHGMILGEGGIKMSKSRGNVINPTDVIAEYGADTMRTYIIFIGDFEKPASWATNSVKGCKRFLDKVWNLAETVNDHETQYSAKNEAILHKSIKKVTSDIDALKGNTALAQLMTLTTALSDNGCNAAELKTLLQLLSPFAPHIADEIWQQHGFKGICSVSAWPSYDEAKCKDSEIDMAVQVNGKLRGTIHVPADLDNDSVVKAAVEDEKIARFLEKLGGSIIKTIVVKNKLVNLIVK